jgi:tetratricopeptide (TPR) repeat protein
MASTTPVTARVASIASRLAARRSSTWLRAAFFMTYQRRTGRQRTASSGPSRGYSLDRFAHRPDRPDPAMASDNDHAATACKGLGDVLFAQSQWQGAEAWYNRGLQYAKSNRALIAAISLGLGDTAIRRSQLTEAADQLQRALEIYETLEDEAGLIRTLLARGSLEGAQGKTAEVLASYREALSLLPMASADPVLEIAVRLRLAELYLDLGRLPDSENEARRAEDIAISHQLARSLARVYVIMGRLRGRQGDENGFVFFEQAIELCRSGEPARRLEADVYREYATFRTTMGDRHEARAYLERARDLLEPFGDDVALDRINQDLRQLDVWLLTDGAPSAPQPR